MNIIAITKPSSTRDKTILERMHRLRGKIFRGRLSWNVRCVDGLEFDEFDALGPTYIIALDSMEQVVGCARLLPATSTTMLETVFPQLLPNGVLAAHKRMIESSRFCVDTGCREGRGHGSLHEVTMAMFAGIVDWCLVKDYTEIATATDVRIERLLHRAGWPMRRIGEPVQIHETRSIAGVLSADHDSFRRLRPEGYQSDFAFKHQHAA